jgi:hypothetical protein
VQQQQRLPADWFHVLPLWAGQLQQPLRAPWPMPGELPPLEHDGMREQASVAGGTDGEIMCCEYAKCIHSPIAPIPNQMHISLPNRH